MFDVILSRMLAALRAGALLPGSSCQRDASQWAGVGTSKLNSSNPAKAEAALPSSLMLFGNYTGFWVLGFGFLGLALKVLGFGLRFFGGWAWGLGFG